MAARWIACGLLLAIFIAVLSQKHPVPGFLGIAVFGVSGVMALVGVVIWWRNRP